MDTNERLDRIEEKLDRLLHAAVAQPFYTVKEFAGRVGEAAYTIRQKCNLGQIVAEKALTRCGPTKEWRISHAELERYRKEGNLPIKPDRNRHDRPAA